MIRRYRHITQRPDTFRLNHDAQAAQGLVFAGLAPGGLVGGTHYHDSSLYGNHGTLTNMDGSNWLFDPTIGRWCQSCNGSDEYVLGSGVPSLLGVDYTVAVWCKLNTTQANYAAIWSKGDGTASDLSLQRYSNTTTIRLYHGSSSADITGAWSTIATGTWVPVILTYRIASNVLTLWVSSASNSTTISADQGNSAGRTWKLGADRTPSVYTNGSFADWLIATRAWSEAECLAYSDLSNTMLSGLILPPRRMVFPAAVTFAPSIPSGSATISAVANLTATGHAAHSGSATLSAIASLTATGYHQSIAYATVSAIADLTAVGYTSHAGTANLSSIVGLSATGYAVHTGSADISAIADMVAVGESPSIIPEGSATLSAIADMTAVGYASHAGEAVLYAVADIAAVGYHESAGYAVLAAVADMVAVGSVPGEEGEGDTGTGGKTADGLTWPDVDGLEWEEVDGLEWTHHTRLETEAAAVCVMESEASATVGLLTDASSVGLLTTEASSTR